MSADRDHPVTDHLDALTGGRHDAVPFGAAGYERQLAPLAHRGAARPCWGVVHGRRASREGARAGGPERRLMLAGLMDAVHRCRGRRSNVREGGAGWRVEDAWLRSEDRTWPFSFASICDYLGLDSTYLRHRLLRRTRES